jgi:hypothetical protein
LENKIKKKIHRAPGFYAATCFWRVLTEAKLACGLFFFGLFLFAVFYAARVLRLFLLFVTNFTPKQPQMGRTHSKTFPSHSKKKMPSTFSK